MNVTHRLENCYVIIFLHSKNFFLCIDGRLLLALSEYYYLLLSLFCYHLCTIFHIEILFVPA